MIDNVHIQRFSLVDRHTKNIQAFNGILPSRLCAYVAHIVLLLDALYALFFMRVSRVTLLPPFYWLWFLRRGSDEICGPSAAHFQTAEHPHSPCAFLVGIHVTAEAESLLPVSCIDSICRYGGRQMRTHIQGERNTGVEIQSYYTSVLL